MTIHISSLVRIIKHQHSSLINILGMHFIIYCSLETSARKSDNPINIDWSNVNCKEFDKFSEHLGYATTTFATSISSRYNTNRNDFMGFVKVIEGIFQQSMNDPVSQTLIAKTGTASIKSVLELSFFKDICQLIFGVYDNTLPILTNGADSRAIQLLKSFHSSCETYGPPIKEDWSNVNCEDFDEFCTERGFITTTSIEEDHITDKHPLTNHLPSVLSVQYNRLDLHQQTSNMLSLSSEIKEMSNSSNTSSCLLEKEALDENKQDNSSIPSIHVVQSNESFETNDCDQQSKNHVLTTLILHIAVRRKVV